MRKVLFGALALVLIACGGSGGVNPVVTTPREQTFNVLWGGTAQSVRVTVYRGNQALDTEIVNLPAINAQLTIPDSSATDLRVHAEGFDAAGAGGNSLGKLDTAFPLASFLANESFPISTRTRLLYALESTSGSQIVGQSVVIDYSARDSEGVLCIAPPPTFSVDNPSVATLTTESITISPPSRNGSVGTRNVARLTASNTGSAQVTMTGGSFRNFVFEPLNLPTESTYEGTWTGILNDGRTGFPAQTLYTTTISAPNNGNFPITWISSYYEPYRFEYNAFIEGNGLTAFAGQVTLTRDGESLVISQPNAQQSARLKRTSRSVKFRAQVGASRRLASGNVEVDVILTNEGGSTLTGIELTNITLNDFGSIAGSGQSPWPYGSNFGSLSQLASARRTLTFPSGVQSGAGRMSFGTTTQQGVGEIIELQVAVPPNQL